MQPFLLFLGCGSNLMGDILLFFSPQELLEIEAELRKVAAELRELRRG